MLKSRPTIKSIDLLVRAVVVFLCLCLSCPADARMTEGKIKELEKLADAGRNFAQAYLCVSYGKDGSSWEDDEKAFYYCKMLADKGHLGAQFFTGARYETGDGVTQDLAMAEHYYALSAKGGFTLSEEPLLRVRSKMNMNKPNDNVNKDLQLETQSNIARLHKQADKYNEPFAQHILSGAYFDGTYVKKDKDKGLYYAKLAANQGYSEAQYILGFRYYQGQDVEQNYTEAFYYS